MHRHIGTVRQLEILASVHEHGSISMAAKALFLTQPTVSMQLKKLSDAIDMPLFDQIGKKITLTEAGLATLETAKEVMASYERLHMSLSDMHGLKAGTLKLAVVTTSKYFIPHLLAPFCEKYPAIEVQLKVGNRAQIIERMKQGLDDFYVFSHIPTDVETEQRAFSTNPLVAVVNSGHSFTNQKRISLAKFLTEPFIMREPGSGTRMAIEQHSELISNNIDIRMTIESNEAIKHCVMAGMGVSILSAHTLAFGGDSGLVQIEVDELPIETKWKFVWLKAKRLSLIAKTFLDYVDEEGRDSVLEELKRVGIKVAK